MSDIELSIVVPAYNEEKRLPPTINKITKYFLGKGINYELIIVDNGSHDNTQNLVKKLQKENAWIRLISLKQKGKGIAVKAGVLAARGKYILFTDADLSTPIEEIEKFWPHIRKNYHIVYATRELSESKIISRQLWYRIFLGNALKFLVRLLIFPNPPRPSDTQCGFKMYKKNISRKLFNRQTLHGGMFDIEILFIAKKHKYRLKEIPVTWSNEKNSKVNIWKSMITDPFKLFGIRIKDILGYYK